MFDLIINGTVVRTYKTERAAKTRMAKEMEWAKSVGDASTYAVLPHADKPRDFILKDDNPKCPRAMSHWENAFDRAFPKGRKPLDHQTYAKIEASAFTEYMQCEGH